MKIQRTISKPIEDPGQHIHEPPVANDASRPTTWPGGVFSQWVAGLGTNLKRFGKAIGMLTDIFVEVVALFAAHIRQYGRLFLTN
jgi:hypothetical protein